MGKSPGKWIKTVLFGKKGSRSNSSNGRHASKATLDKETWVAAKEPTTDFPVDPPSVSEPIAGTTYVKEGSLDVKEEKSDDSPCGEGGILPESRDTDMNENTTSEVLDDPERIRQEQAAIKAQTAFRGYLARRAFWALKGIIRLQALVRGYLVRRQAITTLRSLQAIIKFQTLLRSKKSKTPLVTHSVKLSENAFVSKLLRSPITAVPLRVHYLDEEPNSAWSWLERWTISGVWQSVQHTKKINDLKSPRQDQGRSKRTIRKIENGNGMPPLVSEPEKPKRNLRKVITHQDPVQEQPQNEFEKVKRSLRKVSNSIVDATDSPKRKAPVPDTPDNGNGDYNDMSTENFTPETKEVGNVVDNELRIDLPPIEIQPSETIVEEEIVKESEKSGQRKTKEENVENGVQNSPTLPSYMQATQSAKAKLRLGGGGGSPKVVVPEKNGVTRRHSLPSSINGKVKSMSPRPLRLVKNDASEKIVQTGWRR